MKRYYTYMMTNRRNTVLYTGMTNDIERRVREHKEMKSNGFASKYRCVKLVWFEEFPNPEQAIEIEKRIKNRGRAWKRRLIEADNPHYLDLASSLY